MLYTPPEEACSEDIKPKCGTRAMPRGPAPCLRPLPRASAPRPPHRVPARVPAPRSSSTDVTRVPLRSEREVHVVLDPLLGLKLRPHQREGVTVRFEARIPP